MINTSSWALLIPGIFAAILGASLPDILLIYLTFTFFTTPTVAVAIMPSIATDLTAPEKVTFCPEACFSN